jgi:hypothetical protein
VNTIQSALSSPRTARILFWLGAVVLVAGTIFFLVRFFGRDDIRRTEIVNLPSRPSPTVAKQTSLDPRARRVATHFIETAVRRKNLAKAWRLAHPDLRQGMTREEWLTGTIPVVPYTLPIRRIRLEVTYSAPREAQLRATLIPRNGSSVDAAVFEIGLTKVGRGANDRWLVDYWGPANTLSPPPRTTSR